MTVAAGAPQNSYIGTGGANQFAFTFPVFLASSLLVEVSNSSGVTTLVLNTDYTVSGLNGLIGPSSTGSITLINSGQAWLSAGNLATGYTLEITSNIPYSQPFSIRDQGDMYRSAIENALDNLEYQIQQLQLAILALQTGGLPATVTPIYVDTVTSKTYQLQITNGQFGILELT